MSQPTDSDVCASFRALCRRLARLAAEQPCELGLCTIEQTYSAGELGRVAERLAQLTDAELCSEAIAALKELHALSDDQLLLSERSSDVE